MNSAGYERKKKIKTNNKNNVESYSKTVERQWKAIAFSFCKNQYSTLQNKLKPSGLLFAIGGCYSEITENKEHKITKTKRKF